MPEIFNKVDAFLIIFFSCIWEEDTNNTLGLFPVILEPRQVSCYGLMVERVEYVGI